MWNHGLKNWNNIEFIEREYFGEKNLVSKPMVLKDRHGFYVGELYWDEEFNCPFRYSKLSFEHYQSKAEAEKLLPKIFKLRSMNILEEYGHV